MYNAIFDDELLNDIGIYKERLSQSALVAAMRTVTDEEATGVRKWFALFLISIFLVCPFSSFILAHPFLTIGWKTRE
jgi:hypothetical protein